MDKEEKNTTQCEALFLEGLELFNNSDASDDKLELRIMDLFRQSARLGNTDALVLLTECKFFMKEDEELLNLFQTALKNGIDFEDETYLRYLWLEDKLRPTPVRAAIVERARKGDKEAIRALRLCDGFDDDEEGDDDENDLEWPETCISTSETNDTDFDDPFKLDENDDPFALDDDNTDDDDDKPF